MCRSRSSESRDHAAQNIYLLKEDRYGCLCRLPVCTLLFDFLRVPVLYVRTGHQEVALGFEKRPVNCSH